MVLCVAYNCKSRSGQGISLFEFPKDEKRKQAWLVRVRRENFSPSPTARLCAKHFDNEQFVVNPVFAASIGYKIKKLQLKPDAVPTIFDYSVPAKKGDQVVKRKGTRTSSAVDKRRRLETMSQILKEKEMTHDATCTSENDESGNHPIETSSDQSETESQVVDVPEDQSSGPITYNAYIQTSSVVTRTQGTQTYSSQASVATQTSSFKSSLPAINLMQPSVDIDDNESPQKESDDPDWLPECELVDDDGIDNQQVEICPSKMRKFIVFEKQLLELLQNYCPRCGRKRIITSQNVIGTCLSVTLRCDCQSEERWSSQPFSGSMPLGNLIIAAAVMFAGCSISKVLTFFRHASVCCFSGRTFSSIQSAYLIPAIQDVWGLEQAKQFGYLQRDATPVTLGGDARCCTPGHTAKYGSYSLMNLANNKVLDLQLVQSNEVPNSYHMELEGLKRCLTVFEDNDINISGLVTDRHPSIKKYMREQQANVTHMFDVWHVSKGIYKKLEQIGKKKKKGCQASQAESGCCGYQMLEKIVTERTLKKDIMKLSPGEQTSSLESFHRVVCFFAPKSIHFMHAQMEARLYLAALHFNENSSRRQAVTAEGTPQFRVSYPKSRRGEGVAKEVKTNITYGYVESLYEQLLIRRDQYPTFREALENVKGVDKQRPPTLSRTTPRRPKEEIVQEHVSRFNRN